MKTSGIEKKKKVYCISVMQNWGGGEEFLLNLCENLNDYEFVIITPEGIPQKRFEEAGIKTILNNVQKKIYRDSGWNLFSIFNITYKILRSTFRLSAVFIKEKPDLILANGLFAALYAIPASVLTRRILILIQHLVFYESSVEQKIIKLVYRFIEKIVSVSETVRDNLIEIIGEDRMQKIIVIPNSIKVEKLPDIEGIVPDIVRIGMTGSIIRIKGIDLVINAATELLKSGKAVLKIFGSTTEEKDSAIYKTELENLIRDNGIHEFVRFEGHIESKDQIYSGIDMLVNYSIIAESFSFSVLEAMLFGKIVIAANQGGPKEIIQEGISGFLVEAQNGEALKARIEYCVENIKSDFLKLTRQRAKERVKEYYSIVKFSANYRNLFHSLLNKG